MPTKHILAALCFVFACLPDRSAADTKGDGLYARWDHGLTLSLGAGAGATWLPGDTDAPRLSIAGEARLLFIDAAGPVVAGRWGRDSGQYVFVGVDVRPLFPALFFLFKSTWREFWDLFLQSLSVELGAAFMLDGHRSVGFAYGFGLGMPIVRPKKALRTVWLRVGGRHVNARPAFVNTPDGVNRSDWTLYGLLSFDFGLAKHLGSWEPPRYRSR